MAKSGSDEGHDGITAPLWESPSRVRLSGSRAVAGKEDKRAARGQYNEVRPSVANAESCRRRRQAWAMPGFARQGPPPARNARSGSGEDRDHVVTTNGWCGNLIAAGRLQPGESVLVVVDGPLREEGAQLVATAADAGGRPQLEPWNGAAPPVEAGRQADLLFLLLEEPKSIEVEARFRLLEAVTDHGGRALGLLFVDGPLLRGELSQPQPNLTAAADRLLAALDRAETVHVRGAAGTDLALEVGGRRWHTDARPLEAGGLANFPGGEVFVAPHSDGADGVLVADLTVPYTVPGLVDEPVTLHFERGRVTSVEGGKAAALLRELVESAGRGADVIAELGIGFNPTVRPRGHVMLDEKAAGTAHIAIGRNSGPYGGDNDAQIHVDCVFSVPEITADGHAVQLP